METPSAAGMPNQAHSPAHRARRRGVVIAVAVVVAIIAIATSLLATLRDDRGTPSSGPLSPSPTTTGQGTTTDQKTTTTPTATTSRPNAAEDLAAFLSAAATLDRQLRDAAAAINAAGPPWADVGPELARVVNAADLTPVARAIPAGLPHEVLQSVILVYSDLSSRRHAMSSFGFTPPAEPSGSTEGLLNQLRNGHEAAARFAADLAATQALAAGTPPIAAVPNGSRLVAEVLLLVARVDGANGGCGTHGGVVVTELPKISWEPISGNPDAEGTISGIAFTADHRPDSGWKVALFAC